MKSLFLKIFLSYWVAQALFRGSRHTDYRSACASAESRPPGTRNKPLSSRRPCRRMNKAGRPKRGVTLKR